MILLLKSVLFLISIIPQRSQEIFEFIMNLGIAVDNQPWSNVTIREICAGCGSEETPSTNPGEFEFEIEVEIESVPIVDLENETEIIPDSEGETTNEIDQEVVVLSDDWTQSPVLPNLADKSQDDPKYYSTIRVLTLGPRIWVFARGSDGMEVYNFVPSSKTWKVQATLPELNDANKWGDSAKYYSTIRVIYYSGSFWLLARNAEGLQLYQYDPLENTWTTRETLTELSDQNGWDREDHYSSIQAFGSSGKIWVFARGEGGLAVHQYNIDPDSEKWIPSSVEFGELADSNGWSNDPKYYSTIRIVPVKSNFWLFARNSEGMQIYNYDENTQRWALKKPLIELSDGNNWDEEQYYSTIQTLLLSDNDDDYVWLFARNQNGLQAFQYNTGKNEWKKKKDLPDLNDNNKWDSVEYYSTIQTLKLNTTIALVARGPDGLHYYEYSPVSDTWSQKPTLSVLSDDKGWDEEKYYSTITAINFEEKLNVLARGPDGMYVYYKDEP